MVAPVAAWLVHADCDVTGECFTVGGGYVGRVAVAVHAGRRWGRPMTPESVRDGWSEVMADREWRGLPAGSGDLDRVLVGFRW